MHLHNGHYTALIFQDDNTVTEIDDAVVRDVSQNWRKLSSNTVYLAFYCKNENAESPTPTNIRKHSEVDPHQASGKKEYLKKGSGSSGISNEARNKTPGHSKQVNHATKRCCNNDELKCMWDLSWRDEIVCKFEGESGYVLYGKDLKTLELPSNNSTYILENPGWLNDNIIDAYLSMLSNTCANIGVRMFAFSCHFFSTLRSVLCQKDAGRFRTMISRYFRRVCFELYDCLVIPISTMNGRHWCVVYIDVWKQKIFYYDPMDKGIRNESAITLIKFYFKQLLKWRSCEVCFSSKHLVTEFNVIWENESPSQNDNASCGVYVLMYVSSKLHLLHVDPAIDDIGVIRKSMALELFKNEKYMPEVYAVNSEHECNIPSLYRRRVGERVVLRCKCYGSHPDKFKWIFNDENVSSGQMYTFKLTRDTIGTYVCEVEFDDGVIVTSSQCEVGCILSTDTVMNEIENAVSNGTLDIENYKVVSNTCQTYCM